MHGGIFCEVDMRGLDSGSSRQIRALALEIR